MAGGRISVLANGGVNNGNIFGTTGVASGGSVHIGTLGKLNNEGLLTTGGGLHGGSLLLKAGNDIVNDEAIYYAIGQMNVSGGLMGGTMRILPKNDFGYTSGVFNSSIAANGSLQGGIIEVNAGRNSIVDFSPITFDTPATIIANGTSSTSGRGGFIHLHAGNNNVHNGTIEAIGGLEDGTVLFTSGN